MIIKNPQNISALHEESEFNLGKNLNVFYGENGTGKSSYAKVFRKLANNYYTNAKDLTILPNVYASVKGEKDQTIQVIYSCNDETSDPETININEKHPILSQMNVFDSASITPLLNSNLTFSVLPQGFSYFNKMIEILDLLRIDIDNIISEKEIEKNKIFSDSSFDFIKEEIQKVLINVKKDEFKNYLDKNFTINDKIEEDISTLETEIKELENSNPAATIKLITSQKAKLVSIKNAIQKLSDKISDDNIEKINKLINDYQLKLKQEKELNDELAKGICFLKEFNTSWIDFITSGITYYESIKIDNPKEGDSCIYCGQKLNLPQINLIETYLKFLKSDVVIEKNSLINVINQNKIESLTVTLNKEDESLIEKEKLIERIKSVITLINKNKEIFQNCIDEKNLIMPSIKLNFDELSKEIVSEITSIDERLIGLSKSNLEIAEHIKELKSKKQTFEKNLKLHNSISQFTDWSNLNESVKKYKKLKSNFTTNTLTIKSKEAFEGIVQDEYIKVFEEYSKELNVPNVNISFTPQKGKTFRSKFIMSEMYKVTDIMSEGEQNAIAMAEFSTDLRIRKNYNTVLFDDPVSSLDYKRAESFANAIYKLSKDRQVIVFTHNIMFYYFLYNACLEAKNPENKFFKVDEYSKNLKGLVSESFSGRLETLKEISNKIKNHYQKIASPKCIGDELENVLGVAYSDIRTWCELIVEEGFLKKIIRRYEPNIIFAKVSDINADFVGELQTVSDIFERSCRWMKGHSQPYETQNVKADREAFLKDYEYIISVSEKYKTK